MSNSRYNIYSSTILWLCCAALFLTGCDKPGPLESNSSRAIALDGPPTGRWSEMGASIYESPGRRLVINPDGTFEFGEAKDYYKRNWGEGTWECPTDDRLRLHIISGVFAWGDSLHPETNTPVHSTTGTIHCRYTILKHTGGGLFGPGERTELKLTSTTFGIILYNKVGP
jgi:hypothetical protein